LSVASACRDRLLSRLGRNDELGVVWAGRCTDSTSPWLRYRAADRLLTAGDAAQASDLLARVAEDGDLGVAGHVRLWLDGAATEARRASLEWLEGRLQGSPLAHLLTRQRAESFPVDSVEALSLRQE